MILQLVGVWGLEMCFHAAQFSHAWFNAMEAVDYAQILSCGLADDCYVSHSESQFQYFVTMFFEGYAVP